MKIQLYYFVFLLFICKLILFFGCSASIKESKYPKSVGDIMYDSKLDKKDFFLCNENNIIQYHNDLNAMQFKGEKIALVEEIKSKFKSIKNNQESGLIRIRFVVNCQAETDRFRLISMDENYKEYKFDENITNQLMTICKELKGWIPKKYEGKNVDYYQYLIFKISKGQLIEIMP